MFHSRGRLLIKLAIEQLNKEKKLREVQQVTKKSEAVGQSNCIEDPDLSGTNIETKHATISNSISEVVAMENSVENPGFSDTIPESRDEIRVEIIPDRMATEGRFETTSKAVVMKNPGFCDTILESRDEMRIQIIPDRMTTDSRVETTSKVVVMENSDEEGSNSSEDFSSDDSFADPSFSNNNNSSSSSSTSSSDTENSETFTNSNTTKQSTKRKVLFASNSKNTTRKRLRHDSKWQRNDTKLLRNSGKAYQSFKKIVKQDGTVSRELVTRTARNLLPPCGEQCRLRCSNKLNNDERQVIFDNYWEMANLQRQCDFIATSITPIGTKYGKEHNRRSLNNAFHFPQKGKKMRVCKQFFIATLGITTRVIRTVMDKKDSSSGIMSSELSGKHGKQPKVSEHIKEGIRIHIRSIPRIESHYCRASSSKEYIDGAKSICDLYRDYKKKCNEQNEEYGNYIMYNSIYNNEFKLARFKPKKDQCEFCMSFNNSNTEDKQLLLEKYESHILEKELARVEKERDKTTVNNNEIVAVYDLQAVLPCPQGDVSTFYYVSKLNVYNFTIFNLKTKLADCYIWHEGVAFRGSMEIASCVWRFLEKVDASSNIPIDVIFYSDNCCGQNKNSTIIAMYHRAISYLKNIKSITHKYLITGHTQNEGDAVHSVIETQIKNSRKSVPIFIPDQLVSLIRVAKKTEPAFLVHELTFEDFYKFDTDTIEIGKKNELKEDFMISNIKIFSINKSNPFQLLYKTSFGEHEFSKTVLKVNSQLKITRKNACAKELKRAYTKNKGVSESKKAGFLKLINKKIIPRYYCQFYQNL